MIYFCQRVSEKYADFIIYSIVRDGTQKVGNLLRGKKNPNSEAIESFG